MNDWMREIYKKNMKILTNKTVFLTHVGIRQMPTWLTTRKAKLLYHVSTFLPSWLFLSLEKFKTIKIKPEQNPYTNGNACLLHISRNFKDIFKYIYICFALSLANCKQLRKCNRLYRPSLCFFSRSNQFRVDLII